MEKKSAVISGARQSLRLNRTSHCARLVGLADQPQERGKATDDARRTGGGYFWRMTQVGKGTSALNLLVSYDMGVWYQSA